VIKKKTLIPTLSRRREKKEQHAALADSLNPLSLAGEEFRKRSMHGHVPFSELVRVFFFS
jgi:hypothetical protein